MLLGEIITSGLADEYARRKAIKQQESAAARAARQQQVAYNRNEQKLSGLIKDGDVARDRLNGRFEFDVQGMFSDPAYQSELSQGLKQLENALAAGGLRRSSTGGKAVGRFLQNIIGSQTDRYFNRQLSTARHNSDNDRTLAGLGGNANAQLATGQRQLGTGLSRLLDATGDAQSQATLDRGLNAAQTFSSLFKHFQK